MSANTITFNYQTQYDSATDTLNVLYIPNANTIGPVRAAFSGKSFIKSDGTLDEANLHMQIKRYSPVQMWQSMLDKTTPTTTVFDALSNQQFSSHSGEVASILQTNPTDEPYGWNEKLHTLQKQRNAYLYSSDWMVAADSPLDANTKAQWVTWRQEIRDMGKNVNANTDPTTLTFSTPPGGWTNFLNKNVVVYPGILSFRLRPFTDDNTATYIANTANTITR